MLITYQPPARTRTSLSSPPRQTMADIRKSYLLCQLTQISAKSNQANGSKYSVGFIDFRRHTLSRGAKTRLVPQFISPLGGHN